MMTDIEHNLRNLLSRIRELELLYGRTPGSVKLLAVSKTRTVDEIKSAIACRQYHFGENYMQEALAKIRIINNPGITWHFIGPIQSNKTGPVAEHFSWVHSVDRLKIARRLNAMRPPDKPPLNFCIQVNISHEPTKSGINPDQLPEFLAALRELPRLRLRGLMTMPELTDDFETQRRSFKKLREHYERLSNDELKMDTLSMGTTTDMEAAIAEGATVLRIGTAIFGPRK